MDRRLSSRRRQLAMACLGKEPAPTDVGGCAFLAVLIFFLGLAGTAHAAQNAPYTVTAYGTDQGLPSSVVLTAVQTRDGYLWLGTLNGLVRFDGLGRRTGAATGVQFPVFDDGNTPGLNSSVILKLFEDSKGNLWIGTETAGVVVARQGRIVKTFLAKAGREGRVKSICEDSRGTVWLYTADGQLFKCESVNGEETRVTPAMQQPSVSRALLADDSGMIWLGADNGVQVSAEFGRGVWGVSSLPAQFLLASKNGAAWLLGQAGIFRIKDGRFSPYAACPWNPTGTPVNTACEDAAGNLVVGTGGEGIFWFESTNKYTQITNGYGGLSHNTILSLCVDKEGDLWVGTDGGGLDRVKRPVFEVMENSSELAIRSVCDDGSSGLWLGSFGHGVAHWRAGGLETYVLGQPSANNPDFNADQYVTSVFRDGRSRVWAGTYAGGLFQFDGKKFNPHPTAGALRGKGEISAFFENRAHRLWAGTRSGLAFLNDTAWTTLKDGPTGVVRAMAEDAEGSLWVGWEGRGVGKLQSGKWTWFTKTNGLPSDNVYALYADPEGAVWAGTLSGLARFRDGKWSSYPDRPGLSRRSISYLMEDPLGFLWMGSNGGLMRAPKRSLNDLAINPASELTLRSYDSADGLPTGECTRGAQPAACKAKDGKLWFPTIHGLVSVNPEALRPNTNPPPVLIEAVKVDGDLQGEYSLRALPPQSITIPPRKQSLEIDFTSLNLSAPDKGLFRYCLQPHEPKTNELPATTRSVRYPKLPQGDYLFYVTACNEDGVWNQLGSTLSVKVLPPFWRTWWFLTIETLAALGIIVGVVSYVSTQKLQRQVAAMRQQEALERERARIARDLHDQLGANLTQVALLSEMAEADKNIPDEVESHAQQIGHTARETTHALDEIVWTVNPSNDTVDGLINYICKYAQDYLALAGLKYRLEVPPQLPSTPISPELRHNVFLVVKESVNNVVKHAHASSAWLRLHLQPDQFVIEVEDDGRGLKAADWEKGRNGLRNMKKRMEDVGGDFQIGQRDGGGTKVRLVAPLKKC
jgi:ligand-binding sensor domain-containing protein